MIVQRLVRPFNDDELLYLEDPRKLAIVSRDANSINIIVEIFDKLQTPIPWVDASGVRRDAAVLTVTPTPQALNALAIAAGYPNGVPKDSAGNPCTGLFAILDPTSTTAGAAWNLSGSLNPTNVGSNGIITGNVGPSPAGPHLMLPGSRLQLGLYLDIS